MPADPDQPQTTDDAFLGGKLRLLQPRRGHRAGHEAILLAAATPARIGEQAVDLGAGIGTAGLALAARVEGLSVTLVEIDSALAGLAAENAKRNALDERVSVATLDVNAAPREFMAAGITPGAADHVLMNPPFNDPARHPGSPDPERRRAHLSSEATLTTFVTTAGRLLKPGGTLTLIWRADELAEVLAVLAGDFGGVAVLPVHANPDAPAIRILVRANKGSRGPLELHPGLLLADASGKASETAEAVLRRVPKRRATSRNRVQRSRPLETAAHHEAQPVRLGRSHDGADQYEQNVDFHCRLPLSPWPASAAAVLNQPAKQEAFQWFKMCNLSGRRARIISTA
jgi:tRNA1(Val) A37 N6-methylase TrmN6